MEEQTLNLGEAVYTTLTVAQISRLREELRARKSHYAGLISWQSRQVNNGAGSGAAGNRDALRDELLELQILDSKLEQALIDHLEWEKHGESITAQCQEMLATGERLASMRVPDTSLRNMLGGGLLVLIRMAWIRLTAALRRDTRGHALVEHGDYYDAGTGLTLHFPDHLQELAHRVARAFRKAEDQRDLDGNEVVLLLSRDALPHLWRVFKHELASARGQRGHWGSEYRQYEANSARNQVEACKWMEKAKTKVAEAETREELFKALFDSVDQALMEPFMRRVKEEEE